MNFRDIKFYLISVLLFSYIAGCSSSKNTEESDFPEKTTEKKSVIESAESYVILNTAKEEQKNQMYSPDIDSTYLYWTDNELIVLHGSTKCNIYAMNVLYRSGFKTPEGNALAADLYDTSMYRDILPVIGVNDISDARKGDLVVWSYHVIIFESLVNINGEDYALAWWAGTRQTDNGENIINNVCHGRYKLDGEFVVRRPLKK